MNYLPIRKATLTFMGHIENVITMARGSGPGVGRGLGAPGTAASSYTRVLV